MAPTPPPLSDDQRRAALAKAAEARRARAELKEALAKGEVGLADVFERAGTDEVVAGTRLLAVLEALPNIGKVRSRRTLTELDIGERQRVRGVGPRQRERLLERFGAPAPPGEGRP